MTPKRLARDIAQEDTSHRRQSDTHEDFRFFTVAQVAEMVGVCTRTVRRWIKNGKVVAHRIGATVRIAESDLKAFFSRHRGR